MTKIPIPEKGNAYLSEDRFYRWALSRVWGDGPMMLFIGLNPSTADENRLDPTMRRVGGFAQREGCGGMWMGNIFGFRSTSPLALRACADPIGEENDRWLRDMSCWCSDHIVCGWGANGAILDRGHQVRKLLDGYRAKCLGMTAAGHPKHPLYLRANTPLIDFPVGRDV